MVLGGLACEHDQHLPLCGRLQRQPGLTIAGYGQLKDAEATKREHKFSLSKDLPSSVPPSGTSHRGKLGVLGVFPWLNQAWGEAVWFPIRAWPGREMRRSRHTGSGKLRVQTAALRVLVRVSVRSESISKVLLIPGVSRALALSRVSKQSELSLSSLSE
ncbi:unnamed protein product [Symbiodinium natans]|uniref:Uncharacterized protein n=1 Tax=Symbiodinium natans TaxID=878477 RepID=A0A812NJF5_9DINO|nr:unnamed protein product [Symbiodinium natans]